MSEALSMYSALKNSKNTFKIDIIHEKGSMFNLFKKDPIKKLEAEYSEFLSKSVNAQRRGDIELYSELAFEADKILKKIEKLKSGSKQQV